jgi:hypothetical protein
MIPFAESVIGEAALAWWEALRNGILHRPDMALGEPGAERDDYWEVIIRRPIAPRPQPRLRPAGVRK